jgi:SNF2 family DNA or RNA helicase
MATWATASLFGLHAVLDAFGGLATLVRLAGAGYLADDMGLGKKSRTAVIALREADAAGPYLIICPAGVKLTWRYEIQQVEPGANLHVVQSAVDCEPNHRWTVVNYDLPGKLQTQLGAQR